MWGQTRMTYVLLFVISATFRNLYRCWISRQLLLKCSPLFYSLKYILKKMSLTAKRSFHLLLMLKSLLIIKAIEECVANVTMKKICSLMTLLPSLSNNTRKGFLHLI